MANARAKQLRQEPTEAEARLWNRLRRKQLDGFRFRRQVPIDSYIVDFFCPTAKLIVEVDGGQHANKSDYDKSDYDKRWTKWLEARGYRVLRFWNNEVLGNTDGVIAEILRTVRESPPPYPSPSRGEGIFFVLVG